MHPGGPASLAEVFVDGRRVNNVTKVEITLNAANPEQVTAIVTFVSDIGLDLSADLLENWYTVNKQDQQEEER